MYAGDVSAERQTMSIFLDSLYVLRNYVDSKPQV